MCSNSSDEINPCILDQYAGSHQSMQGMRIRLAAENGRLVGYTPGEEQVLLDAEAEQDFRMKGACLFMLFKRDAAEDVAGFHLETFDGGTFVKKEKD